MATGHVIYEIANNSAVWLSESHLEQHINGRRHQFMLAQLRQRLCARRSVFVRGFLYGTTSGELGAVFGTFGGISQVIVNQEKVMSSALSAGFYSCSYQKTVVTGSIRVIITQTLEETWYSLTNWKDKHFS